MIQAILQSKLLWKLIGILGRYQFQYCTQGYIRLLGKRGKSYVNTTGHTERGYQPYLRLSYEGDNMWYYRENGEVGEFNYDIMIINIKLFIKHDKLRGIQFY